jgi:hypothetical protein
MGPIPNMKLYKECPQCRNWAFGQYDMFCPRYGAVLKDGDKWIAGINCRTTKTVLTIGFNKFTGG